MTKAKNRQKQKKNKKFNRMKNRRETKKTSTERECAAAAVVCSVRAKVHFMILLLCLLTLFERTRTPSYLLCFRDCAVHFQRF